MCALLSCQGLTKAFGAQELFSGVTLVVNAGDIVGLIGPNGSGKSTLLKILCGLEQADSGTVFVQKLLRIGYLSQEDVLVEEAGCADNLYAACAGLDIDEAERYNRVNALLSRARFPDPQQPVRLLSGGWRKRLAVCRALVCRPDILVMDEPTNHLDIEGILWLERLLGSTLPDSPAAVLMVSHDRRFLENTVNRVIELAPVYPEGSFQIRGGYADFLEKKTDYLLQRQGLEERLANKVRRETEWLRRGPKARTTKARYRIEEAGRLQDELGEIRDRNRSLGQVGIAFDATGRRTKKLLTATGLEKGFSGQILFSDLDVNLTPGLRLGLLGRNGSGKSTLMRILASSTRRSGLLPDTGAIALADGLRIVSFDQRRQSLDPDATLRRALAPEGDSVIYQGQSLHVVTWAKRFLFRTDQLETPVYRLSGGEQARILIARLMLQPADVLLLDEPTNDLDIPSLDVLEESLCEFPGALVLVTHDRFLLDRVCNLVLGFDGAGRAEYFADYDQWLAVLEEREREGGADSQPQAREKPAAKPKPGKLSYMDQREYDQMEEKILAAEARLGELETLMAAPEVVANPGQLQRYWQEQLEMQAQTELLYDRWNELERIRQGKTE
ncbi:MAG: ABC-F family ATP-binding cassette domain-containing protein [Desulfobulbus sp.]|jgi:ATP-binding cassette subfamily F protein uup|uniref:ABC-F family ATP-binding cassette domain-containing protein n=1 Tax=Desulfobulbus sp. TaxID=895 RepID=UPI0028451E15|nr:ABC-F family ATP-binding cassette domain-containing protein [Desulfobulbus sp.]MDR2550243.1 ABC-F family ATP-binding cassette domain-containing protein [Desulfobulbus sp.]